MEFDLNLSLRRFAAVIFLASMFAGHAAAQSYAQWCATHGLPADATGSGALPASHAVDGIPNLLKFGLGFDPWQGGYSGHLLLRTTTSDSQTYLALTGILPIPTPSGISYTVELSSDLKSWTADGVPVSITTSGGLQTVTIRDSQPIGGGVSKRFMRLSVAVTAAVPSNTVSPQITGTLAVGQTLSGATGVWNGGTDTPVYSYQWTKQQSI